MLCKSCVTRSTQPKATPKGVTTRGKTSGSLREMGTQGQRLHQPISLFKQLKEQQLTYLSQKGPGCSCGLTFHRLKRSIHQFLPQKPALEQEKLLAQGCPIIHIPTQKSHFPRELETRKKKIFSPSPSLSSLSTLPCFLGAYVGVKRLLPAQVSMSLMQHISWTSKKKKNALHFHFQILCPQQVILSSAASYYPLLLPKSRPPKQNLLPFNRLPVFSKPSSHLRFLQRSTWGFTNNSHCSQLTPHPIPFRKTALSEPLCFSIPTSLPAHAHTGRTGTNHIRSQMTDTNVLTQTLL